jgi:hypothetical protein
MSIIIDKDTVSLDCQTPIVPIKKPRAKAKGRGRKKINQDPDISLDANLDTNPDANSNENIEHKSMTKNITNNGNENDNENDNGNENDNDNDNENDIIDKPIAKKRGRRPKYQMQENLSKVMQTQKAELLSKDITKTGMLDDIGNSILHLKIDVQNIDSHQSIDTDINNSVISFHHTPQDVNSVKNTDQSSIINREYKDILQESTIKNKKNVEKDFTQYADQIAAPLGCIENDDNFSSQPELLNLSCTDNMNDVIIRDRQYGTETACFWDCHTFDYQGLGMPINYNNKKFYVTGYFCSFNCMAAHNFFENTNQHDKWQIYSWINLMASEHGYKNMIKVASHRQSLSMFGGSKSIEEFRKFNYETRSTYMHQYPMVSVINPIEEINDTQYISTMLDQQTLNKKKISMFEQRLSSERKNPVVSINQIMNTGRGQDNNENNIRSTDLSLIMKNLKEN